MPSNEEIPHLIARRRKRRSAAQHSNLQRFGLFAKGAVILFSLIIAAGVISAAIYYSRLTRDLPSIEQLPILLDGPTAQLHQATQLIDRSGELITRLENPNSSGFVYLPLDKIPQHVLNATLAASDPGFWEHGGFKLDRGTPNTLAEILVSDLLLWQEPPSLTRDLRQTILAAESSTSFTREKILEWYLNRAAYGQMAYGIDQAARVYFNKPAVELSLAEAAMLAASSQAPALNPIDAPQVAIDRQEKILQKMLSLGFINQEQALNANSQPMHVLSNAAQPEMIAAEFIQLALKQLSAYIPEERLLRGGLVIETSLDSPLQLAANCTVAAQLARLRGEIPLDLLAGYDCDAARLLPTLLSKDAQAGEGVAAQVIVLDPTTGQILALVGDPSQNQQTGSILTPFVYFTAFTRGLSPASLVWDIPANLPQNLADYGNFDGEFHGPMRIRTALANDYMVPALHTLTQIGAENIWRTVQQSGLEGFGNNPEQDPVRLLLDQGEANLLEITYAYSMFANQGTLAGQFASREEASSLVATSIISVKDTSGRTLLDWQTAQKRPITNPQFSYLITDILADESARRPSLGSSNPLNTGFPSASKIGQTFTGQTSWTVGYTPQRVVGVWVGYEDKQSSIPISPLSAAGIWNAVLKTSLTGLNQAEFTEPFGIMRLSVCDPSGLLPNDECPNVVKEVFLPGNEPFLTDNLYRSFQINSRTGLLATVFTPSEFVETKVFLVPPPEAQSWVEEAGIETPPDNYDVIFNPEASRGLLEISSPEIFEYVSGNVPIQGQATIEDFAYFRIQIGEGLNPRQWLQVGDEVNQEVINGQLAMWDTTGLDGLYAIQLQVIANDQSIENLIIQVTVDNTPPEIQITLPAANQIFEYPSERNITFQTQVNDNLGLRQVVFLMDDVQISSLTTPPFSTAWTGNPGSHQLTVRAIDLAGNLSEVTVDFELTR